jgi:peptide/nickel transport system substrate-binding protein
MMLRDRALVGILSVALIALSIAALAPSLQSSDGSVEPTPPAVDTRRYVEGVLGRATNASPFGARTAADRALVSLLFRGLVRLGPGSTITGDLAERWEVGDDGRTWTFHLRDGLYWEDGEPITAADVTFTVDVLSDPAYMGPGGESWRDVRARPRRRTVNSSSTALGGFLRRPRNRSRRLLGGPLEQLRRPVRRGPVGSGPFGSCSWPGAARRGIPWAADPNFATPRPTIPRAPDTRAGPRRAVPVPSSCY